MVSAAAGRRLLVTDGASFPTDQYVAEAVTRLHGLELRRVEPAAELVSPLPPPSVSGCRSPAGTARRTRSPSNRPTGPPTGWAGRGSGRRRCCPWSLWTPRSTWDGVDLAAVRAKSLAMSDLVIAFCDRWLPGDVEPVTPRQHHRRGSQVSLRMPLAYETCQALGERGVIADFRTPDLLRLGLAPLYVGYAEVWHAMEELRDVMTSGAAAAARYARTSGATVT